jgi:hypothetical protein
VTRRPDFPKWQRRAASAVYYAADRDAIKAAWNAPQRTVEALVWRAGGYGPSAADAVSDIERRQQAAALRDIFRNPFRERPDVASSWRAPAVVALAAGIYQEGRFEDLPILADALEQGGCTAADLLDHLRGTGRHVRGCWVVDLLTGRG